MRVWWLAVVVLVACGSPEAPRKPPVPEPVPEPIVVPPQPLPPFEIAAPTDAIVSLGRGDRYACVVRASGAVDCWGQHAKPPCNDCYVPAPATSQVRRVPAVTDAIAISRDGRCIARRGGDVACLDLAKLEFVPVAGMGVASTVDGPCALVGTVVKCVSEDKVVEVANLPDIVELRATILSGCVVRKSGDVWCGYLGDKWARVRGLDHVESLALTMGWQVNACAATRTSAKCMQLDVSSHVAGQPADMPQLAGAHDLSLHYELEGRFAASGIVGGKVVEVELTGEGATTGTRTVPVLEDATKHVFGCALRAQGSVVCWGDNRGGVLAQPTTIEEVHLPPTKVVGLTDVADIAIGTTETFALTRAGQLFHWGGSSWRWQSAYPTELPLGAGPSLLVQIDAIYSGQLCMRSATGLVWCQAAWGIPAITRVETSDVQRIVAGGDSIFAIRANGYVEEHGIGREAIGGDELLHATDVVDVATNGEVGCFLKRSGTVRCHHRVNPELEHSSRIVMSWHGVCGLVRGHVLCSTLGNKPAHEVPGIVDATDLASNRWLSCAVHHGGRVTCWESNEKGEVVKVHDVIASGAARVKLGAGSEAQLEQSHMLDGPAPGGAFGCAIMMDRTVTCWGTNLSGELGDGSIIELASPIGVVL